MRVKILAPAEKDLEEGFKFYESQYAGLGSYFIDSLFADIDSLEFFAGIHQKSLGFYRQLASRFPFAIYYQISPEEIVFVFAVLDCRRKPSWIRQKLRVKK